MSPAVRPNEDPFLEMCCTRPDASVFLLCEEPHIGTCDADTIVILSLAQSYESMK